MAAALYLAEDLEKAQAEQVRMRAEWADRLERLAADAERHAQA
jgi:hypothetical protein